MTYPVEYRRRHHLGWDVIRTTLPRLTPDMILAHIPWPPQPDDRVVVINPHTGDVLASLAVRQHHWIITQNFVSP
ncbi:hypothetical protein [Sulfobacillus thermosulfidooxidans]|uniref:hypothetical protein n=1 Tax=Sulfobacillus thermosulfidooxidans TaxID=28034 RepID=UPI0002D7DBAC|nr:hypothetical protein [Sulfobacillus thermosulfidooxidans]